MSYPVPIKPEARADAAEAARWYSELGVILAERFLSAVRVAVGEIGQNPTAHPLVDPDTGARRIRIRGFPYRLFYLIEPARVVVFAIAHDKRDQRVWHNRLE